MKIICPHCKQVIEVQLSGRKPADIAFTNVCNALRRTQRADGSPHYTHAARFIETTDGIHVSPALFQVRVQREATRRGIKTKTLLQGIMSGQVTGKR